MKLAFSTNAFRKFSFDHAAKAVARAGYRGIEIMCDTPHAFPGELDNRGLKEIKDSLTANALEISNLNAFMMCAVQDFHHPSWIEKDKTFRQVRIDYTRDCIDLAAQLGARTISTEPGGPLAGMDRKKAMEVFAQGLELILPHAREKGITVLIEPEPDLLLETSEDFLTFMDLLSHPNLGLNFDVGHFFCMGEDPADLVPKLNKYTRHYHMEDIPETREHRHIMPGTGGIDIAGVLDAIQGSGYNGFVTIELYPYLDQPARAAADALAYINGLPGHD